MGRQLVLCPSLGKASSEGRARVGRGGARADEGKELKQKKKKKNHLFSDCCRRKDTLLVKIRQ